MVKRLSEDARRLVLGSAAEEARRRGDRRLGTDHLLLGLLHDPTGEPARALGVDLESARATDDALDREALAAVGIDAAGLALATDAAPGGRPALTSGARAVFQQAIDQARPAKTGRIETRHFLLALLDCERPDPAAELLQALGVDPSAVRARLAG
jgi:ATP-dependent Clp protease ATP-binding subunit ClpA